MRSSRVLLAPVVWCLAACGTAPSAPPVPLPAPVSPPASSPAPTTATATATATTTTTASTTAMAMAMAMASTTATAIQPRPVTVPQGVNAGIAVFDRSSGAFTAQVNAADRFRSASLVKILIALDFLLARGPGYEVGQADRVQLELMLRGSDDRAASYFYQRIGGEPGIKRMITLMALENTAPPSAVGLNGWGSTTLSANDMVRVYQYILERSPVAVREIIMGNLRQSTPCGTDAYHQS